MAKLIVHVGMPRIAPSPVHAVLARMRDALSAQGVWVPPSPLASRRVAVEATAPDSKLHQRRDFQEIKARIDLAAAVAQCKAPPDAGTVLLSSEYFSEADPRRLREVLQSAGIDASDATIVAVIRRQDRMPLPLNAPRPPNASALSSPRLDWYARLQPWAGAFGKAAIKVLVFDRIAARQETVTGKVLEICGVAFDPQRVREIEAACGAPPDRIPDGDLHAFRRLADRVVEPQQIGWIVDAAASELSTTPPDAAMRQKTAEHFRASNRRLVEEYLGEAGDLFDDTGDEPENPSIETLCKLVALCAARMPA